MENNDENLYFFPHFVVTDAHFVILEEILVNRNEVMRITNPQ